MRIGAKQFEAEIVRAMGRLPRFLAEAAEEVGVAVLAHDRPAADRPGDVDGLFAEYIGPTAAEFHTGESAHPPVIALYRSTFESECETEAELREEIYRTIVHELGHFLGLDEDALEDV